MNWNKVLSLLDWKKVFSTGFIVAVVVLLLGTGTLWGLRTTLGWVLFKKPVELRVSLRRMAGNIDARADFGSYNLVKKDSRLTSDIEKRLGTENYIGWVYRDTSITDDSLGKYIRFHVAYYTGSIDTVPHVPERCVAGGGSAVTKQQTIKVELNSPFMKEREDGKVLVSTSSMSGGEEVTLPSKTIPLRVISFEDRREGQVRRFAVTYFFVVNGEYVSMAEEVRLKSFNITDRYAYYCKIEVVPVAYGGKNSRGEEVYYPDIGDVDKAVELVEKFLSYGLPEVMRCLPDWDEVAERD